MPQVRQDKGAATVTDTNNSEPCLAGFTEKALEMIDAALAAPPAPSQQSPQTRLETTSEHIARDIREGRFPNRSEPQRAQSTEWGPMPDAGTESDFSQAPVAHVAGNDVSRYLEWDKNRSAWERPIGTPVYYAAPRQQAAPAAEPVGEVYRHGEGRDASGPREGIRLLPAGAHLPHGTKVYAAPAAESAEPKGDVLRTFLDAAKDAGITHLPGDFAEKLAAAAADAQGDEREKFYAQGMEDGIRIGEQRALSRQPSAPASAAEEWAAFEEWYRSRFGRRPVPFRDSDTERWEGWQARAALAAAKPEGGSKC